MKTLRLFSTILMVVTLCFGMAACDDDDDKDDLPPSSLIGTWEGDHGEFAYKIVFGTSGNGQMTVKGKDSGEVETDAPMTYTYNSTTGIVTIDYLMTDYTGNVQGNRMSISRTGQDGSLILRKN